MKKWVCPVCGYVHEGDVPPAECPVCHVSGDKFTLQSEEKTWAAEHVVGVGKVFGEDVPEEVRHAHHVEDDAQRDKHRQYQQRYHVTCALQRRGGEKAHNGTERYRQQEYPQRPAALLFAFLFILTVTVCQVTNLAFLIKFFIWIE